MRARRFVIVAALSAGVALTVLPAVSGAAGGGTSTDPGVGDLRLVVRTSEADALRAIPSTPDPALVSAGSIDPTATFVEVGPVPPAPPTRPAVAPPATRAGMEWKPARYTMTGIATFYDHGTTAMRLPRGTVIRVCGPGGCLERVVSDYGPFGTGRIIDLYRADFFAICGCPSWAGTAEVTVHVY